MIKFKNVSKNYGTSPALQEVSFNLLPGSFNFITGHSGAGKSTLLRLIAGLEVPSDGELQVGPYALHKMRKRDLPGLRQQMGIVFQDNQLLPDRSVFDNIALPLIISGRKKADIVSRVLAALKRVALSHKATALPGTLSGGEQQRVGIARAVVNQPSLLIADEPTGNLDPEMSQDIIQLFQHFNSAGVTVLIATHDMQLLTTPHNKRLELSAGRILNTTGRPNNTASRRRSAVADTAFA